jgi:hypothetical protein
MSSPVKLLEKVTVVEDDRNDEDPTVWDVVAIGVSGAIAADRGFEMCRGTGRLSAKENPGQNPMIFPLTGFCPTLLCRGLSS